MNYHLLFLALDGRQGQSESWEHVEELVRNGLANALGALIWVLVVAVVLILGLNPRARTLLFWIRARVWATVLAAGLLTAVLGLIVAAGFGWLPAGLGYLSAAGRWPLESVSVPRVVALVVLVLAFLKLWDWRVGIASLSRRVLLPLRQLMQPVRRMARDVAENPRQTSSAAEAPTQTEATACFVRLAGQWDLTYGRGGRRTERCEIDSQGQYFLIDARRGSRSIRPAFTLRVRHLDQESGHLCWEKMGPEGDVLHAEELTFQPGNNILLLHGYKAGDSAHLIRYRRR